MTTQSSTDSLAARIYADVDVMNATAFAGYFTKGASLQFGNDAPVTGKDAIEATIAGFFSMIGGIKHEILGEWRSGDALFCDIVVTYTRLDGTTFSVPTATLSRLDGDLIRDYRVYIDNGGLFS